MVRRSYLERFSEQFETYKDSDEARDHPELVKTLVLLSECLERIKDMINSDHEDTASHRHRVFGAYTEKAAW